ncbi:MAG: hypothetical protein A2Z25_14120 [Planctomycetes bacterium RBG_16_55_9]|nr:MAG: hypothetical protein A2Z25_14120 [Planctomycetes bacterium RBG_16_55_9]
MKVRMLLSAGVVLAGLVGITAANMNRGRQNQGPACPVIAPSIELTEAETLNILHMREEEKLARDVYLVMYELWGANVFANISQSEQRHMDAVKNLILRYGLIDPVVDDTVGEFTNPDFKTLYDELVAAGSVSLDEALKVGVRIEELDITDLEQALTETSAPDVQKVFENLLNGSYNHLDAFTRCLEGGCMCLSCM